MNYRIAASRLLYSVFRRLWEFVRCPVRGDLVPSPEPAGASPGMVQASANQHSARGDLQQEYMGQVWVWISVNQRPC